LLVATGDKSGRTQIVAAGQDFLVSWPGPCGMYVLAEPPSLAAAEKRSKLNAASARSPPQCARDMQEAILSLMHGCPARRSLCRLLKEAGLPYIVVLTTPHGRPSLASYADVGDGRFAEPNALDPALPDLNAVIEPGPSAKSCTEGPSGRISGWITGLWDRVTRAQRCATRLIDYQAQLDEAASCGTG